jgi:putative glutathione S-transferase
MGYLLEGQWHPGRRDNHDGAFVRQSSMFRESVSADGRHPPAAGRYRLYVSLACPWASRAVIVRKLKKLGAAVSMTVVHPDMLENGWTFGGEIDATTGRRFLHEIYRDAAPKFSGHATVPMLWDSEAKTIVNNESSDIIRMLNREFDEWGDPSVDLYPADLAAEIDAINDEIYGPVNNGVYRAGFATKETAYHDAVWKLFEALERIDARLATNRFLVGPRLTEADVRLFTTAVRFDLVYYSHFKCNVRHLRDFENIWGWLKDVYQLPGVDQTVDFLHIKRHYYGSQTWVNPTGIVPVGPTVDLRGPTGRERFLHKDDDGIDRRKLGSKGFRAG